MRDGGGGTKEEEEGKAYIQPQPVKYMMPHISMQSVLKGSYVAMDGSRMRSEVRPEYCSASVRAWFPLISRYSWGTAIDYRRRARSSRSRQVSAGPQSNSEFCQSVRTLALGMLCCAHMWLGILMLHLALLGMRLGLWLLLILLLLLLLLVLLVLLLVVLLLCGG